VQCVLDLSDCTGGYVVLNALLLSTYCTCDDCNSRIVAVARAAIASSKRRCCYQKPNPRSRLTRSLHAARNTVSRRHILGNLEILGGGPAAHCIFQKPSPFTDPPNTRPGNCQIKVNILSSSFMPALFAAHLGLGFLPSLPYTSRMLISLP
jgi:hypothetical protein